MLHAIESLFYRQAVQIYFRRHAARHALRAGAFGSILGSHWAGARPLMARVKLRDLTFRDNHCTPLHVYHEPTAVPYLAHDTLSEASLHRVTWCES